MSKKKTGDRFERWILEYLRKQGWYAERFGRKCQYVGGKLILKGHDVAGCDILALKENEKPLLIQATCHSDLRAKVEDLEKYPFNFRFCDVQIWQKVKLAKKTEVRVYEYIGDDIFLIKEIRLKKKKKNVQN